MIDQVLRRCEHAPAIFKELKHLKQFLPEKYIVHFISISTFSKQLTFREAKACSPVQTGKGLMQFAFHVV
jgi:hypothetical protein